MPIFEFTCRSENCRNCGVVVERYLSKWDKPNPECPSCNAVSERLMSGFAVVFTGVITAKYNDKKLEGGHNDGHFAWRTKGTRSGKPEMTFIETFQQQKEFAKSEGCVNPKDMGPVEVGADGRSSSSAGLPGCWV